MESNKEFKEIQSFINTRFYSSKPHSELKEKLNLFGQFVGIWEMDTKFFDESGSNTYHQKNEWTFFWILDGRAIQDVLIGPNLQNNLSLKPGERRIGTTIRMFNTNKNSWEASWLGITTNAHIKLSGEEINGEIILTGLDVDGSSLKWIFKDIKKNSFTWVGFISKDNGKSWRLEQEMIGKRINSS